MKTTKATLLREAVVASWRRFKRARLPSPVMRISVEVPEAERRKLGDIERLVGGLSDAARKLS